MKLTNKLLKRLKEKEIICEIRWLDIVADDGQPKRELKITPPKELLSRESSYGKIFSYDNLAIVVLTSDSEKWNVDYVAIPKSVIIDIIEYKEV